MSTKTFPEEVGSIIWIIVQAFIIISSWVYIIVAYWNDMPVPGLIYGVGAAVVAKLGIEKVVPAETVANNIRKFFGRKI